MFFCYFSETTWAIELRFSVMVHLARLDVCVMFHDLDLKVKVTARSKFKFTFIAISPKPLSLLG